MNFGPDERLLRLAEMLADGGAIDWDILLREDPDLAAAVERFREIQALSTAHRKVALGSQQEMTDGPIVSSSSETPLFTWGEIHALQKIGEGGFAEVYRAWDPSLEREVALKLIRSDGQQTVVGIRRWLEEARRLAKVRHP